MLKMSTFDRQDWYAWAGAEPFEDGREPLIGELELLNGTRGADHATVIWDQYGLTVHFLSKEEGHLDEWALFFGKKMHIPAVLEQLSPVMEDSKLRALVEDWADDEVVP